MGGPQIRTRKLGRSGIELTELGLGTAPLGELFVRVEDQEADAVVASAWDDGVRFFDTSPWYGRGLSEHRLGRMLWRKPRETFVLSTKVGRVLRRPLNAKPIKDQWLGGLQFQPVFDYSYDGVMRSFEDYSGSGSIRSISFSFMISTPGSTRRPRSSTPTFNSSSSAAGKRSPNCARRASSRESAPASTRRARSRASSTYSTSTSSCWRCVTRCSSRRCSTRSSRDAPSGVPESSSGAATIPAFSQPAPFRAPCTTTRPPRSLFWSEWLSYRGGLQAPRRPSRRGGAPVPAWPPNCGLDHSRRGFRRPGGAEPRRLPPSDPDEPVGGTEAGKARPHRRADAEVTPKGCATFSSRRG